MARVDRATAAPLPTAGLYPQPEYYGQMFAPQYPPAGGYDSAMPSQR